MDSQYHFCGFSISVFASSHEKCNHLNKTIELYIEYEIDGIKHIDINEQSFFSAMKTHSI